MHDMKANLLWQMMQSMGGGETLPAEVPEIQMDLPPPLDMLASLRPMMPPREQRLIDLMIKLHELKTLMNEFQSESL